jgi:hypothetical protein
MKKLLSLILIFLVVSELNAISTDEYGRDVYGHDRDGGHTVSRHVDKSYDYLRSRCRGVQNSRTYTTYRNASDASLTIRDLIRHPVNKERIDDFKAQDGRRVRTGLVPVNIKRNYSTIFGRQGFGVGIDCLRLGEKIKTHWLFGTYYQNADEYNYLRTATATLGYNHTKRKWYIQTSFPVLKRN